MPNTLKPYTTLIDFVTGREVPNIGAEENRQAVERFLVEQKGYSKTDIEVDAPIAFAIAGENYRSSVDLVVRVNSRRVIAIKCAAGSLGSREREILSAARLLDSYQIPFAAASDGRTALVWATVAGRTTGEGLGAIPSKTDLESAFDTLDLSPLPEKQRMREQLIFRTYDIENVNAARRL